MTDPDGGNGNANVPTTLILHAEGFEQEAAAVATAIGAPALVPSLLTEPLPGDTMGASVVVVLGPALAHSTPTTVPTAATGANTTTPPGRTHGLSQRAEAPRAGHELVRT